MVIGAPQAIWDVFDEETRKRLLNPHPNVVVEPAVSLEQFVEKVPQADGAMVFNFKIPNEVLQPGSRLRWVHSIPAGVDRIMTPELIEAEHVSITASKGPHAPLIAEHMLLLMLSVARHMPALVKNQEEHHWTRDDERSFGTRTGTQMLRKTIAVLGVGQIGDHIARMCKVGFGMKVLGMSRTSRDSKYVDRYFDRSELHEALQEADVVALCLSLTPSTEKIIGEAEFEVMKPTALLINAARGGLIDEDALIDAMNTGKIGGAGLDTVALEPLPEDSPLWDLPNTIITSHIAAYVDGLADEITRFLVENIRRFAEGEPLLGTVHRHEGY
jgi:phosphoglycerate dehydrogenase-like enzyme